MYIVQPPVVWFAVVVGGNPSHPPSCLLLHSKLVLLLRYVHQPQVMTRIMYRSSTPYIPTPTSLGLS